MDRRLRQSAYSRNISQCLLLPLDRNHKARRIALTSALSGVREYAAPASWVPAVLGAPIPTCLTRSRLGVSLPPHPSWHTLRWCSLVASIHTTLVSLTLCHAEIPLALCYTWHAYIQYSWLGHATPLSCNPGKAKGLAGNVSRDRKVLTLSLRPSATTPWRVRANRTFRTTVRALYTCEAGWRG